MLKLHRLAVFPLEIFITKRTASAKYVSGLPHSINSANSPKETLQIKLHANPGSIFHSDWMRLLSYYFYDCDPNGYANVRRTRHPICSVLNSDNIRPIKVLHLYHGTGYCKRFIPHRFFNLQRIPFPYKLKVATRNPSLNVFFFFFCRLLFLLRFLPGQSSNRANLFIANRSVVVTAHHSFVCCGTTSDVRAERCVHVSKRPRDDRMKNVKNALDFEDI